MLNGEEMKSRCRDDEVMQLTNKLLQLHRQTCSTVAKSNALQVVTVSFTVLLVFVLHVPLRRLRSFEVTDFGTNRKSICDFLLVINTNLHPISHHFEVIADYWSNLRFRQRGTPLWHTRLGWTHKLRTTKFSHKKLETLLYCMVFIYLQTIISFCHNPCIWQTDGWTNGQTDVDSRTMRMLHSRTVKITRW